MHLRWAFWITLSFVLTLSSSKSYEFGVTDNNTDVIEYVLLNENSNPCARKCILGAPPMICRYNFTLESYHTLSKACYNCPFNLEDCYRPHCIPGDGNERSVSVVNRQMPGPSIEVCLGDEVIVDVSNFLQSESTSIHFHGNKQKETPYMDGVPYITQCPILPGNTFRYRFKAVDFGTHFWHSHSGMQRADGVFGSYTVRVPKELDPHADLYDYDLSAHNMIILDWTGEVGISKFTKHHHSDGDNKPSTVLVNGRGRFVKFNQKTNRNDIFTPVERFQIQQGFRYRFRVINAGYLNCPIEISVDNHTLIAIAADGQDIKPQEAESIVTYAGERFDFILNANQSEDLYWMRFRGLMDCDERFKSAHQVAVLEYAGAENNSYPEGDPNYENSHKEGLQINALNKGSDDNTSLTIPELSALPADEDDVALKEIPDIKYFVSYDFYKKDNPHYHYPNLYGFNNVTNPKKQLQTPQLNYISLKFPPFPLLPQRKSITSDMFCNETTVAGMNCETDYCECTHVVQVPLGAVVEMILIDKGFAFNANHPFHLHGHSFRVVAIERVGENVTLQQVEEMDKEGLIERNLVDPPYKDTVTVPDGGFTIVRFEANNPGYWIFHCHIEFHVEVGMGLVFKVGEHDQMKPVPRNFPQCGNYVPSLKSEDDDAPEEVSAPPTNKCDENASAFTKSLKMWFPKLYESECNNSSATTDSSKSSQTKLESFSTVLLAFVAILNFLQMSL